MADDQDALKWATAVFRDSTLSTRYDLYGRYARGDHDLAFATPKYAATFGTLFREFGYNRCATIVDAIADRLQVERFNVEKGDGADETAGDLWRRNRMDGRAGEVHKAALRDGDAYLIVWPETGTANGDQGAFPQFWPQTSSEIRVRYDDEQPGKVTMAVKTWLLSDKRRRLNLYFPDRIEKYVTKGRSTVVNAEALERFNVPGEPWPVRNDWDTVPVFHFANNAGTGEYGASELRDVIPLQDALNKVLTDILLASELTAYSVKVMLGVDAENPQVIEAATRIEIGRSKMLLVPPALGDKAPSIDEFTAENIVQLDTIAEGFDKRISRVSKVPVHHLQMSGDFPSGRAMRTAEGPFIAKIEDRQTAFGNVWEDAMHLALRMAGVSDPGMLTTVWKSAAPLSKEDQLDVALQQSAIGIPFEQIVRELGYDEEEIAAMVAEKQAAVDRQMQMDVALTGIGGNEDDERGAAA
jgi:hypothetical protein